MDSSVNPVGPGGIYGVQPTGKRKREEDTQKKPFKVDKAEKPAAPPDSGAPTETLTVSEREENESGGTLDLTA